MPQERSAGKPSTRRYTEQEKAAAIRMVRTLRAETGSEHGTVKRVDGLGGRLAELFVPASVVGFTALLAFCRDHVGPEGCIVAFGVEGTRSYGIGLARFLRRQG